MTELTVHPQVPLAPSPTPRIEATFFRSDESDYELRVRVRRPGVAVREAVVAGEVELALKVEEPAILLAFRVGEAIPWTLAGHDPAAKAYIPPFDATRERRAHMDIFLIDDASGEAVAMRSVVLWLDFSRRLDEAIRDQTRLACTPSDWRRAMSQIRRRCPTPEALAAQADARSPGHA